MESRRRKLRFSLKALRDVPQLMRLLMLNSLSKRMSISVELSSLYDADGEEARIFSFSFSCHRFAYEPFMHRFEYTVVWLLSFLSENGHIVFRIVVFS